MLRPRPCAPVECTPQQHHTTAQPHQLGYGYSCKTTNMSLLKCSATPGVSAQTDGLLREHVPCQHCRLTCLKADFSRQSDQAMAFSSVGSTKLNSSDLGCSAPAGHMLTSEHHQVCADISHTEPQLRHLLVTSHVAGWKLQHSSQHNGKHEPMTQKHLALHACKHEQGVQLLCSRMQFRQVCMAAAAHTSNMAMC